MKTNQNLKNATKAGLSSKFTTLNVYGKKRKKASNKLPQPPP